jgi:dihydroxy-acid dehydratase
MGTASTMNALAEALGMTLPGAAAIPAPYRERGQIAYETGLEIVSMVHANRTPSDIMTRAAFENAIVANTAIGGSTNAPIHLIAIAKHVGIKPELTLDDWEGFGYDAPRLVNMQPAGQFLGEDYHRAGGLPTVMAELLAHGKVHGDALTANGKTWAENVERAKKADGEVIKSYEDPLLGEAGFLHMKGNVFDSAIMKTSVISEAFRKEFLRDEKDPNAFESRIAVFDGPEDYQKRIDSIECDARTILVMRGAGPKGYPGMFAVLVLLVVNVVGM